MYIFVSHCCICTQSLTKKSLSGLHLLKLGCCLRAHHFLLHLIQNKQLDTECIIKRKRGRQVNKHNTCAVPGWQPLWVFKGYTLHAAFPYFASRRPLKCFRATALSMFKLIAADSQHTTADETVCVCVCVCVCVLVQGPCCALMWWIIAVSGSLVLTIYCTHLQFFSNKNTFLVKLFLFY